ncbi:MAG: nucleotidyltransferase domain-containing protein [Catalinimonas sp.]
MTLLTKDTGLTQTEIMRLGDVFSRFLAVERVVLYGSRATGTHRPHSDVDLALVGECIDLDL